MRRGTLMGVAAYTLWGSFPLYFSALAPAGALEVLVHRVLWALLLCLVVLVALRGLGDLRRLLSDRSRLGWLALASVTIAVNWGVYIYGVQQGMVVEASLGYFANPVVTVLLGVLLLGERLRPAQWAAVGLGALAVLVVSVDEGRLPWIALTLAVSFGLYGLAKNRVGRGTTALVSLTGETLVLALPALAALVVLEAAGRGTFTTDGPVHTALLVSAGLVTMAPLLLFGAAARRVPLSTIGLLQYLTPVLQLLLGVLVLGETVAPTRWVGFGLIWLALVLLTVDTLRSARRQALVRAAEASAKG
ncbi:EamA family transporter RarD [Pseudokineococcus lusitanus]|uniref:Chloramphenicol-sensitive protein RarD n=1 Tax=Pseudokineococcus lusitanus TaxID=763993 RepID=A0A3N1HLB3_9ACTN|nr:EamA family transporter RarD [Pseudokineococcus lusitanus]ROP43256.1 chloramphenicol-sensitive protein RarD [Pseudokineococcus lusitanus]